jgi:glutamyl/glutaminyl-tRNA synthetase
MKTITRFAPTISGHAHLGTIYNALINYIVAKKDKGTFLLRLDGIKLNPVREAYQKSLEEDLIKFGLIPDRIIKQSDRRELYKSKMIELLKHDEIYFCDCKTEDINYRASINSLRDTNLQMKVLQRDEKYPSPSKVVQVKLLDEEDKDIVPLSVISATVENGQDHVENITNSKSSEFWQPFNPGYFGTVKPVIVFDFAEPRWIQSVKITFKNYPWRAWSIHARRNGKSINVARVEKWHRFCTGDGYTSGFKDQVSFAPVLCDSLYIMPGRYMLDVRPEYVYDGFCRDRNLNLDLDDRDTVVRGVSSNPDIPDTVFWIYQVADLSLTSAIDDQKFGVTHSIRGEDIRSFTLLEAQAARRIGYQPQNYIHGEILNPKQYKYSKFAGSPAACEYLKEVDADSILSYLAYRAGLIPELKKLSLSSLVRQSIIDWSELQSNVIIDEQIMIEECKKMKRR